MAGNKGVILYKCKCGEWKAKDVHEVAGVTIIGEERKAGADEIWWDKSLEDILKRQRQLEGG